nr:MAG TPA: hypothetical protein [Bacteriophage sp.]
MVILYNLTSLSYWCVPSTIAELTCKPPYHNKFVKKIIVKDLPFSFFIFCYVNNLSAMACYAPIFSKLSTTNRPSSISLIL